MVKSHICGSCSRQFSQKSSLDRHVELQRCPVKYPRSSQTLIAIRNLITHTITPSFINLSRIIPDHNLFDYLTRCWGRDVTIDFIKNCALSQLAGDLRLLHKIYLAGEYPALVATNDQRTKFAYYNQHHELVLDAHPLSLARQLVNNLQITYLHTTRYFEFDGQGRDGVKSIEAHDLQQWNQHLYEMTQAGYPKRLFDRLEIPFEGDLTHPFRQRQIKN